MCHSGTLSEWSMLKWAKRNGVRKVSWQCGYEFNPGHVKRTVLSHFVPQFDFHLCYHTNARIYALQHGARDDQTLVMHNTIDERAISPVDPVLAKAALIEKYPTLRDKKLVLYVGAVLEEKRLELVFDALGQLGRSDTVFVVVGDGPHLPVLKTRYANRTDWVATGSIVDGVGLYFDAADVFVLPGTGGLAINEAMAHRLPVISGYADGSADDLVVDGVTGYRLRQQTAAELADRLDALLSDLPRARDMGMRGEQRIRGHLSFESFIDRVVGVLETQHALSSRKS
jgi:glycosyltransferase involved in cell wall biosynthesis